MSTQLFDIKGSPTVISKEELRFILVACHSVLAGHNKFPQKYPIKVTLVKSIPGTTINGENIGGKADFKNAAMTVLNCRNYNDTVTIILHEMIHLVMNSYELEGAEHVTSTLTAKLKLTVIDVANRMVQDCYKNAAYFAHCKMSYRRVEDKYNDAQYKIKGDSMGRKYREKRTT